MSRQRKTMNLNGRFEGLVGLLTGVEKEAEGLVRRVVERAEEAREKILDRDLLIREAKRNWEDLATRFQATDLFERARETARQTKDQVLSVLSIPSQDEVVRLSRKITTLEQRVNRLTRKAA